MTIKHIIVLAAIVLSAPSFAKDCEKGKTYSGEVATCLLEESLNEVNREYLKTFKLAKATNSEGAEFLKQTQKAWDEYSSNSCAFVQAFGMSDMPGSFIYYDCMSTFISARIKILKKYQADLVK